MKTPEEKRWELIQQYLFADSQGKAPIRVSSQRTLFGIKSSVEQVIERTVAEDEAKHAREAAASKYDSSKHRESKHDSHNSSRGKEGIEIPRAVPDHMPFIGDSSADDEENEP